MSLDGQYTRSLRALLFVDTLLGNRAGSPNQPLTAVAVCWLRQLEGLDCYSSRKQLGNLAPATTKDQWKLGPLLRKRIASIFPAGR